MKAILEFLVATAIAIAAAVAFSFLARGGAPPGPGKAQGPGAEAAAFSLIDLPPIVTNLTSPTDVWVRLEASIVIDTKATPHPDVVGGEVASDLLAYMRTETLAQLEGPIGLQNLRQDPGERASIRSGGKVKEVILRTLVVQ